MVDLAVVVDNVATSREVEKGVEVVLCHVSSSGVSRRRGDDILYLHARWNRSGCGEGSASKGVDALKKRLNDASFLFGA